MSTTIDLKLPINRDNRSHEGPILTYESGQRGCTAIDRDPAGGWWINLQNGTRYWVSDDQAQCVQREPDRYTGEAPSYAEPCGDDKYKCKPCGPNSKTFTLHGLKTHHGSQHGE